VDGKQKGADMTELPTINQFSNVSNTYSGSTVDLGVIANERGLSMYTDSTPRTDANWLVAKYGSDSILGANKPEEKKETKMSEKVGRRIVKVFIVDPSADVPLDKAIIYQGEEGLTDSTDQELFFEVDIKALLQSHNADRVKYLDKKATKAAGKDVFLEEARIRDLIMMVTEIARF